MKQQSRYPKPPCPKCASDDLRVKETRMQSPTMYKRGYLCKACGNTFSAYAENTRMPNKNGVDFIVSFTYTHYESK